MDTRNHGLTTAYITHTFVHEPAWIAQARAAGEALRPGMQVSTAEGHLLGWLVAIGGAQRILEIGTFMGTSTLWMAHRMGEAGQLLSLEQQPEQAERARQHIAASPHAARIEVVTGDAHRWLAAQPLAPQFDLVFIDAEKSGYADYLEAVLPRLTEGGWIIGDNTLLFGALAGERPEAASPAALASMTRFNAILADPNHFESVLLPTSEGLTVARKRKL